MRANTLPAAFAAAALFPQAALAQSVLLDCEVTMNSRTTYLGRPSSATQESGRWRFRLDPNASTAALVSTGTLYISAGGEHPFRTDGQPIPLTATEDAYSMCLDRAGACNTRRALSFGDWHEVELAHIDRRTGDFLVREHHYVGDLQGGGTHEYHGTCARAPEQQF